MGNFGEKTIYECAPWLQVEIQKIQLLNAKNLNEI